MTIRSHERISRGELYESLAQIVSTRSTCLRAQVGAVIIRDRRIISYGYNGAPPGMPHCTDVGCLETTVYAEPIHASGADLSGVEVRIPGCARAIHAEANAIAWAARAGISVEGAELYCTHGPCLSCAQLMLSAGIKFAWWAEDYRDMRGAELLRSAGVASGSQR